MNIPNINVVIAGDVGTGKSALTLTLIKSLFIPGFDPTVEDTYFRQIELDGKKYNLKITDTVDNEFRNEEQRNAMYLDCDAVILTYAINDADSFNNLHIRYHNLPIHEEDGYVKLSYKDGRIHRFPPIILLGCKADLENQRQVAHHSAEKLIRDLKLQDFVECSSASNLNLEEVLRKMIDYSLQHIQEEQDVTHIYAADEESQMRNSEKRNGSVDSSQSMKTNILTSVSSKIAPIDPSISKIDEGEDENEVTISVSATRPNKNSQAAKAKLTAQKSNTRAVEVKRVERPSTGSTGCCTIM